jgi:peptidylprolyl isomerase
MVEVKEGSVVKVEYTGFLEDGAVFNTNVGEEPLEFTVGSGDLLKGFDEGVVGMKIGEEKEITIEPEDAYGPVNQELFKKIPKSVLGDREIEVGMVLSLKTPDGAVLRPQVVDIDEDMITLDLNHPLAGKTLKFKIKVLDIR